MVSVDRRVEYYPLVDYVNNDDLAPLGLKHSDVRQHMPTIGLNTVLRDKARKLFAKRTGEFRAPKEGEWYLSGSYPEAYKAKLDMTDNYPIVKLVIVKEITTLVEEKQNV